jgi:hypothetical protein
MIARRLPSWTPNWPSPIGEARIIMEEAQMLRTLFNARSSKVLGITLMAGAGLAAAFTPSKAEEKIQPPPYQLAGLNGVTLSVVWDEASIRKALPAGIEPAKGMTGGINI